MVLLIFALGNITIGATKPIFLDSGVPRGEGVHVCVSMVCYHCIVHILNIDLCRAILPNYLRTYSSALCQIRALEKTLKKQNNGQSVPKSWF